MKLFTRLFRLMRINFILIRYNLDEIIFGKHWFYPLQLLVFLNPYYWKLRNQLTRGQRIRLAIEELGPIFVKVGQILSTRRDLLPVDIADELSKLQDRVPPFPGMQAKTMIESALRCRIEDVFTEFNLTALASASIAQVHAATLKEGDEVVIKVLRPNIKQIIDRDTDLLGWLAGIMERYSANARCLKPKEIISEIVQTLYSELDLLREAANASQLRRNFIHSDELYVPKVYWRYSCATVMVLERIKGIPVYDISQLKAAGFNMKNLAKRGIEVFFTQVFRDNFFHADLHPGNIFISTQDLDNPKYMVVDFGIMGSLSHYDQRYIAENMIAFFSRDYHRVAELHVACGWLPSDTRIDQFAGAIRAVSEPTFEKPLHDISFGQLLLSLFQVARQFHMNIQPQLVLLQKTLMNIEGLSRQLYPEIDLWAAASPEIEKWIKKQVGIRSLFKRFRKNFSLWSEQLSEIPILLHEALDYFKTQHEQFRSQQVANSVTRQLKHEHQLNYIYFLSGICVSIVIGGTLFYLHKIM